MMNKVLVLGATSAIAQATVRLLAARGAALYLVARHAERLDAVARDARTRGAARVETETLDLDDFAQHEPLVERAAAALGGGFAFALVCVLVFVVGGGGMGSFA